MAKVAVEEAKLTKVGDGKANDNVDESKETAKMTKGKEPANDNVAEPKERAKTTKGK